jgi:glycosyltransferase involved in cell wall biosynthesis
MADVLYIVVPCYNEEEVLPETSKRLLEKLQSLTDAGLVSPASRILLVNDGSKDRTWELISGLHASDERFSGVCLSRNRGHQNALLAGLMYAKDKADVTISMDADLQDDIGAVDAMLEKYREGCDIVYGVRSARKTDTFFKKTTAQGFYKVMSAMGAETVYNHADYRLMSKRALEGLAQFGEVNLFLRGMVPMVGYKSDVVYYERGERFAGESKYPLKKMLALAFNGISSFSIKPISLITGLGALIIFLSICAAVYALISYFLGHVQPGWTSLILSIWFLGGVQLLCIGLIGQYIGKIYIESKHRPRYNIEKVLSDDIVAH